MKLTYAVVLTQGPNNWNARSPDVFGCVAAADTYAETLHIYTEALIDHLELSAEHGYSIQWPTLTSPEDALVTDSKLIKELAAEYPGDPTDEEEGWSPPVAAMIEIEVNLPQPAYQAEDKPRVSY